MIQSLFLAVAAAGGVLTLGTSTLRMSTVPSAKPSTSPSINATPAGHHSSPRQFVPALILGYNCPGVSLFCGTRGLTSQCEAAWQVSLFQPITLCQG